jgi:hypothetical protein
MSSAVEGGAHLAHSTDDPFHNVLKIEASMVFTEANADFLVETLGSGMAEVFARQSMIE